MAFQYFVMYKPINVLCQFTDTEGRATLGDVNSFPKDVYPVGRLDYESEGLLLLTNDKTVNSKLLDPKQGHEREYYALLDGVPADKDLENVRQGGMIIKINKKPHHCKPGQIEILDAAPNLPEVELKIKERKNRPICWVSLTLTEGKNRQVRKMTAALGCPTVRLVRHRIEQIYLGNMRPGEVASMDRIDFYQKLSL